MQKRFQPALRHTQDERSMVLFFFCRSFFRPAGRKNDLQRV